MTAVDAERVTRVALAPLVDDLRAQGPIRLVAAGKAAVGMARGAAAALGGQLARALVTAATADPGDPRWTFVHAGHPVPDSGSERAGRAALDLADAAAREGGLLLVCLSGGASAMLAVPAGGLSLPDKIAAGQVLLGSGMDIGDVNLVRRHLSAIKGGQLAARAGRSLTLAISDVCWPVDDDPRVVGSGPTVGDDATRTDALEAIARHGLASSLPPAVLARLHAAGVPDGPIPEGDVRLRAAAYFVVASRHEAMRAAAAVAARLGYRVVVRGEAIGGEARRAGPALTAGIASEAAAGRPVCLIRSGETVVRAPGSGRGGRNQELAVAALGPLAELGPAALASIGTDGVDGPTDAAGAFVDDTMWPALGADAGRICEDVLARHDTYGLLDALGGLVRTGPTGTNVADLYVVIAR